MPNPYFSEIKIDKKNIKKKFKKIKNKKIKILLFSMEYLSNKDILSILCLNKEYYSYIKKYFYKKILIKQNSQIDIKKHLSIWKTLLGYNQIKSRYNYQTLKEATFNDENNNKNKNIKKRSSKSDDNKE